METRHRGITHQVVHGVSHGLTHHAMDHQFVGVWIDIRNAGMVTLEYQTIWCHDAVLVLNRVMLQSEKFAC